MHGAKTVGMNVLTSQILFLISMPDLCVENKVKAQPRGHFTLA